MAMIFIVCFIAAFLILFLDYRNKRRADKTNLGSGVGSGIGAIIVALLAAATISVYVFGAQKYLDLDSNNYQKLKTTADQTANISLPKKWVVFTEKSKMDDSSTVVLSLQAENEANAWLDTIYAKLIVRCSEHKTDVYIDTGTSANPELGLYNQFTVRLRLDDKKPLTQRWTESTNNTALFAPNAISLAKKLADSKSLIFEFTPFNSNTARIEFKTEGLGNLLPQVANACNWKTSLGKMQSNPVNHKTYN